MTLQLGRFRHHSRADTLDQVDPEDFREAVALLGVMGYVLADMPETLRGEQQNC